MTQVPPPPLPEPGLVLKDGTVIPGAEAVEAWHRAVLEHRRRLSAENARYKAECARLREQFGPPGVYSPAGRNISSSTPWHQADFDELNTEDPLPDGEYVFQAQDGTWIAADARHYLPPCELEG